MIWPEFEDADGQVISSENSPVARSGTARMWVIVPEMRPFHRNRISLGMTGFMREGFRTTAKCRVIELLGLQTNPIISSKTHE